MWLASAAFMLLAYAAAAWALSRKRRIEPWAFTLGAASLAWFAGAATALHFVKRDEHPASAVVASSAYGNAARSETETAEEIRWPNPNALRALLSAGPVEPPAGAPAAPVATLVERLERRLAQDPADASGWLLLAQSHAFLGNVTAAEGALAEAVDLGVDEQAARERVALAAHAASNAGAIP